MNDQDINEGGLSAVEIETIIAEAKELPSPGKMIILDQLIVQAVEMRTEAFSFAAKVCRLEQELRFLKGILE